MAGSEIDDIFGGKKAGGRGGSSKRAAPASATAETTESMAKKKKKKESGHANEAAHGGSATAPGGGRSKKGTPAAGSSRTSDKATPAAATGRDASTSKRAVTIVDPSKAVEGSTGKGGAKEEKLSKKGKAKLTAEDEEFMDSRGTKRSQTDDGYAVYTEAELGINGKGGDTPLCPFDCSCCF